MKAENLGGNFQDQEIADQTRPEQQNNYLTRKKKFWPGPITTFLII